MFHRNSARIISSGVFGLDSNGNPRSELFFKSNRLRISSVDIQNVECVDPKTRDSLFKSVKLAVEITTASQEAYARQIAETRQQVARGELQRQILHDKSAAESERKELLELQALTRAIQSMGSSKAEAKAQAEARNIEGLCAVKQAELRSKAKKITFFAEQEAFGTKRKQELEFLQKRNELEVSLEKEMAEISVTKFDSAVKSVGRTTISAMARAGPEMQARLLKGLGLEGYLLTDGNSPINLFNAAESLIGQRSA